MTSRGARFGWMGAAALVLVVGAGCSQAVNAGDAADAGGHEGGTVDVPSGMDAPAPSDAVDIDATDAATPSDTYINIFEIIPLPEGGAAGECAMCVEGRCGTQINNCVNNDACRAGFTCTLMRCLGARGDGGGGGMGGFDLACVNSCFMGNLAAEAQAAGAFTCLIGTCGMTCASAFGRGDGGPAGEGGTAEAGAPMDAAGDGG